MPRSLPLFLQLGVLFAILISGAGSGMFLHGQGKAGAASPATQPVQLDDASLDALTGQYKDTAEPDLIVVVYREAGKLYEEGERSQRVELVARSKDHFSTAPAAGSYVFTRDASGKVTGFEQGTGGDSPGAVGSQQSFVRVSDSVSRLNHFREYTRSEVMMPMRDGTKLHAVI